jgi:hypothetical protein
MVTPRRPRPVPFATLREQIARDTLAVTRAIRACQGRQLLAGDEAIIDGLVNLLAETRAAMKAHDLNRARSHSRSARQLASGLDCR